jgi:hypothetical protein
MVSGQFKEENLQKVIAFISDKIKEVEKENDKKEAERLEKLFQDDIESLVKEFLPEHTDIRTPDKPIFHEFNIDLVKGSIRKWNAKGIMDFTSLLKIRYLDTGFSERLTEELSFLDAIENGIGDIDMNDKVLSNSIIQSQLTPRIKECKTRLNEYKNALQSSR